MNLKLKKGYFKKHLLLVGFLLSFSLCFAQKVSYNPNIKYNPEQLKEDFQAFRFKLENNLANLYLYNSEQRINFVFDSLYQNINQPMTDMEFYAYISQTVSIIKDGHNFLYPDPVVTHYYNQRSKFIPYHLTWINDKLMVDKQCTPDSSLIIGSEI